MNIEKIQLRNFRNYEDITLLPHEGVNIFFGANGSGKTNLLEAIHYCALGKSHRITGDQNTVQIGKTFATSDITLISGASQRKISVQIVPGENNKKTILIDGKKIQKFSDMMGCLQCVVFSPEDMGLIKDGPSVRRRYMDMMISQMNRSYFIALQQYKAALDQKNAILKNIRGGANPREELMDAFDSAMAKSVSVIIKERCKTVEKVKKSASALYRYISGSEKEQFTVEYHSALADSENIENDFCRLSRENRENDIRYGITSVGPHRDDLILFLNGKNMKLFASQGQIRTGALSMKLSQLEILPNGENNAPVLLLDDVMSELDKTRRMKLLDVIQPYQTFITCTDETDLEQELNKRTYQVKNTDGKGSITETASGVKIEKERLQEPDFS